MKKKVDKGKKRCIISSVALERGELKKNEKQSRQRIMQDGNIVLS